jgi:ferredoxin/flavodoxin---NADP+ reductase
MSALRCAIVGAGPAGFHAAGQLLDEGFDVDLLDTLPTPFGLVRSGVAPDHPKIKSVTRVFEKTAAHPRLRFFGGVELGVDVQRAESLEHYHAARRAVTGADGRLQRRLGEQPVRRAMGVAADGALGRHQVDRRGDQLR